MKERDILYQRGAYWVTKAARGYEVYRTGVTHSTRCATIDFAGQAGLARAIKECDRRANNGSVQ